MQCAPGEPSYLVSIEEVSTCKNLVHFSSNLLCKHPAFAADKKKDQEVETSRCTTFHLLPLAALQASKADIKRVFRSKAEVSALLNGTQADGFPDDASVPVS